jgi:2-polyprenyl-3-methyl-5-hydroxy-6-metoxy-1,4-benzoquinol methylase
LDTYRKLPHEVDFVVTSNIPKDLGSDVEVVVGLPIKDPWSLGFAHKKVFADRLDRYDLFIYSEDDVSLSERNIEAFLRATQVLPSTEIAGFMRTEKDGNGKIYFSEVRQHFHWDTQSLCFRGGAAFASFTAEHSACYILTRDQLKRAILSGGYLVPPHEGRHDLLVTAATDPYTQCGFRKMICLTQFEDFLIPHMSNKYVGKGILGCEEFCDQLRALLELEKNGRPKGTVIPVETRLYHEHWSKDYYEPIQKELVSLIPEEARTILSVACGWGHTEKHLIGKGVRVTGMPIDSLIAVNAESHGVEIVYGDVETALRNLSGERFDCIVFSNVLHLVPDPIGFLSLFTNLLNSSGTVVASVPNLSWIRRLSRELRLHKHAANPVNYDVSKMHSPTGHLLRSWFRQAGLRPTQIRYDLGQDTGRLQKAIWKIGKPLLCSNLYVQAKLSLSN